MCQNYPDSTADPQQDFRTEWGPIFHRGRLDGSSRVLVIGQDPAHNWNAGLEQIKSAILHPDRSVPLVLYGDAFAPGDKATISSHDIPAGLPAAGGLTRAALKHTDAR